MRSGLMMMVRCRFGGIGMSTPNKRWNIIVRMLWLLTGKIWSGSLSTALGQGC